MNQKLSDIYLKSLKEPENFWGEIANDIFWFKKPTKILNKSKSPFYKWFEDGITNTCYNALDLHIDNGLGDANCPNTDHFFDNMISFPFYVWMEEKELDYMIDSIKKTSEYFK